MKVQDEIFIKSHVARDFLQSAALFKTDKLVVWEYVSNGLQYVDPGTNAIVKVSLNKNQRRITITDNGRGMDWSGLQNFFVMHGENVDRRKGNPGRGRFGTGKSAAFGIADLLTITTVRNGKRSKVQLNRSNIEKMNSKDPIPVKAIEREASTSEPNGTIIDIENVHLKSLDQPGVIHFIERHLLRWPKNVTVFVNNHECEFNEPPIASSYSFRPEGKLSEKLGDVELILKVSKAPLEEDLRGVSIYTNGVWLETTLAGNEGREMAQYILGDLDVPKLDNDKSPIVPFDMSRSMRLNTNNETVQAIYAFVGSKVDEVRRELVERDRKRKADEDAKKLAKQAAEIAKVINEDFQAYREKVARAKAKAKGFTDVYPLDSEKSDDEIIFGSEIPATVVAPNGDPGSSGDNKSKGDEPRDLNPQVTSGPPEADKLGRQVSASEGNVKSRGGFNVEFKPEGSESHRARYDRALRVIVINLEHPQLEAAKGTASIDDPSFRRLAYEVAFSEYAIALAIELAARNEVIYPDDTIWEIRDALNRVARRAANLYSV
jgi:hypothetical protein